MKRALNARRARPGPEVANQLSAEELMDIQMLITAGFRTQEQISDPLMDEERVWAAKQQKRLVPEHLDKVDLQMFLDANTEDVNNAIALQEREGDTYNLLDPVLTNEDRVRGFRYRQLPVPPSLRRIAEHMDRAARDKRPELQWEPTPTNEDDAQKMARMKGNRNREKQARAELLAEVRLVEGESIGQGSRRGTQY